MCAQRAIHLEKDILALKTRIAAHGQSFEHVRDRRMLIVEVPDLRVLIKYWCCVGGAPYNPLAS
jgi:hypothetical protein